MPTIETTVHAPVHNSFRVQQVAGMFDLPVANTASATFRVEIPSPNEAWQIGAIVGPSGSGKSTIARAAFGNAVYAGGNWRDDAAVIDGFGDASLHDITQMLTAVGLGSPPAWVKPKWALSTGEQFRCELARALLRGRKSEVGGQNSDDKTQAIGGKLPISDLRSPTSDLVVFDEFTSVVDRTVAQFASAAVAKGIRSGRIKSRLVAVSCHRDILPWLAPDWVLDMADGSLTWGSLRRPRITLEVRRVDKGAWPLFARHHYLSGGISRASLCWLASWQETPVAFCAVIALYGYVGRRRIHRLVTLPDFQGLGIGARLLDAVAQSQRDDGFRVNITSSHPALVGYCEKSSRWRCIGVNPFGGARQVKEGAAIRSSRGRATVSFEYVAVSS